MDETAGKQPDNQRFAVIFHRKAKKRFDRLPLSDRKKIIKNLAVLRENPLPKGKDLKKMKDTQGSWRIRVGDLRIIYQIMPEKKEVWILDTDYRGRVYKN